MSEIVIRMQIIRYHFMFRILLTIVCSDRMQMVQNRLQQANHGIAYLISGSLFDFKEQDEGRFTFYLGQGAIVC